MTILLLFSQGHIYRKLTGQAPYDEKMLGKVSLIKELYKKGLDRQDILQLYKFIDWIITLPEGLKSRFPRRDNKN